MLRFGKHHVAPIMGFRRWSHIAPMPPPLLFGSSPSLLFGGSMDLLAVPEKKTSPHMTCALETFRLITRSMSTKPQFHIPSSFFEMRSEYPLWEDEEVALPHRVYRDVAKDILRIAAFRLKNNMIDARACDNPLFADFLAALMACVKPAELIDTVVRQLLQLFPSCGRRNSKIRDHFIHAANIIKDWSCMENLALHPFLCSLEARTSMICASAQTYRNFTRPGSVGMHKCSNWKIGYNSMVVLVDAHRLDSVQYRLPEEEFINIYMAAPLNNIAAGLKAGSIDLEARLKAGTVSVSRSSQLLIFRHSMEHINEGSHPMITRQETIRDLHRILGLVCLDVYDFNELCDLKIDVLDRPFVLDNLTTS